MYIYYLCIHTQLPVYTVFYWLIYIYIPIGRARTSESSAASRLSYLCMRP